MPAISDIKLFFPANIIAFAAAGGLNK